MKKINYILLLIFVCTSLQAQVCNERFDFNNKSENGMTVLETSGGFVLCATNQDTLNFPNFGLVFYDNSCNVLYSKTYGKANRSYFPGIGGSMINTYDNGLALGGSITDSLGDKNALLMKFYPNGDTAWTKLYSNGVIEMIAYQVKQTPDSGFVLVGVTNSNAFLIKTDSLGNEQWRNNYGTSATEYGFSVMCTSDGGYLIGGNRCVSCNATDGEISIFKVNAAGNLVWQRQFGNPLYNEAGAFVGHEYPNGDYLFGQHYAFAQWQNKAAVYRITPAGNLVWRKDITALGYFDNAVTSIKSITDSIVLIGGHVDGHSGVLSGYICKIDYNGNIMMKRHYDLTTNNFDAFLDVIQCSDGTYAMAGTTNDGSQDMWFVHTDEYGCLEPDCWQGEEHNNGLQIVEDPTVGINENEINTQIKIYPNPSKDNVFIELDFIAESIQLYSIKGALIYSSSIKDKNYVFNLNEYDQGIYFLLINSGTNFYYKKLVKLAE